MNGEASFSRSGNIVMNLRQGQIRSTGVDNVNCFALSKRESKLRMNDRDRPIGSV